ncbi:hypothetical protein J3R83DRAFT_10319 [Lanmaoa asiatica]|nr:hypothetical protein J3R83DRAFT_10319 [Lanmaoa asiatica]
MAAGKNIDIPRTNGEWLRLLSDILQEVLKGIGKAGSRLRDELWPHVVGAWNAGKNFVIAHPWYTLALIVLVLGVLLAHPLAKAAVRLLGFEVLGVKAGSIAAQIQSSLFGGFVPAGSFFSFLQSFGAL